MQTTEQIELYLAIRRSGRKAYDIAKKAGIHPVRLSQIVHGHRCSRQKERVALARVLKGRADELFEDTGESSPDAAA